MTNSKAEVLAPAGSAESLTAAVRAGADAVYLGAARFSARAGAKNFGPQELKEAVSYCHTRGVKVYLAVNTLMLDDELPDAVALLREACALPVDAVLVQDMGLVRLLRRCAPGASPACLDADGRPHGGGRKSALRSRIPPRRARA